MSDRISESWDFSQFADTANGTKPSATTVPDDLVEKITAQVTDQVMAAVAAALESNPTSTPSSADHVTQEESTPSDATASQDVDDPVTPSWSGATRALRRIGSWRAITGTALILAAVVMILMATSAEQAPAAATPEGAETLVATTLADAVTYRDTGGTLEGFSSPSELVRVTHAPAGVFITSGSGEGCWYAAVSMDDQSPAPFADPSGRVCRPGVARDIAAGQQVTPLPAE